MPIYIWGAGEQLYYFQGFGEHKQNNFREERKIFSGIWADLGIIFREQGSTNPAGGLMIGLNSYCRQVFNYLDPILIYICLWIDCLVWNSQTCSMFPLAFVAGSLQCHWWGFISRNYVVWPTSFLWIFSLLLKELIFICFKFGVTILVWIWL